MKKISISLGLMALLFAWACSGNNKASGADAEAQGSNDKTLGLIESDVADNESDLLGEMPTYATEAPGAAQTIDRSFENAPPLIPHSTDGLLPITKNSNMCLSCHMPEVAAAVHAVPIPKSHMTNYRPEVKPGNGKIDVEASSQVVEEDLEGKLDEARYNCTQCHVGQAKVDAVIQNKFEAVFRDSKLKKKSNLNTNIKEGVK